MNVDFKELERLFFDAINHKKKKRVGLLFSGGLDSRTVLAGLLRLYIKPICYSITDSNDINNIKQISKDYNLNVVFYEADNHNIKTIESMVRKHYNEVDVFYTGLFFNEILEWNQWIDKMRKLKTICSFSNFLQNNDKVYSPIIDDAIVDFVLKLPKKYRRNRIITENLLTIMMPEMMTYPIRKLKRSII